MIGRCDRILWKTTVVSKHVNISRRRPSLKLWSQNTFSAVRRSTSLNRSDAFVPTPTNLNKADEFILAPPTLSPTTSRAEIVNPAATRKETNTDGFGVVSMLAKLLPLNSPSFPTFTSRSKTIDVPNSNGGINGIGNVIPESNRTRKISDVGPVPNKAKLDQEPEIPQSQSETVAPVVSPNLNSSLGMERTMRWILGFFPGREPTLAPSPPEEKEPSPPPVVHLKGEVNCSHYGTLDDSAMRRLEGRSDHRPILGTFSIYI